MDGHRRGLESCASGKQPPHFVRILFLCFLYMSLEAGARIHAGAGPPPPLLAQLPAGTRARGSLAALALPEGRLG